jgi:hypothetical protein
MLNRASAKSSRIEGSLRFWRGHVAELIGPPSRSTVPALVAGAGLGAGADTTLQPNPEPSVGFRDTANESGEHGARSHRTWNGVTYKWAPLNAQKSYGYRRGNSELKSNPVPGPYFPGPYFQDLIQDLFQDLANSNAGE